MSTSPPPQPRLYFAYGSNLSLAQMAARCPTSTYYSLGILRNYKWIIGERGYANVVKMDGIAGRDAWDEFMGWGIRGRQNENRDGDEGEHFVYGFLYTLQPRDEERLDVAEGVPFAYTKQILDIESIPTTTNHVPITSDVTDNDSSNTPAQAPARPRQTVRALVYVDTERLQEGECRDEYVVRMNRGIADAVSAGVDVGYVERCLRPFVPADVEKDWEGGSE